MSGWDPMTHQLLRQLAASGRGPKREGVYALWITLRVAQDLASEPQLPERAMRRRLAALERRLSSLTVPPPIRRALMATLPQLRDDGVDGVAAALNTLVAPARDALGPEAAEAVQHAARATRQSAAASR